MPNQNNNFEEDVKALIEFGGSSNYNQNRLDASPDTCKRLLGYRNQWESIAETLPVDELNYLIKGIVRYDQMFDKQGFGFGGSVSPGIVLCKEYMLRFPEKEKELMLWVIDNRNNPYLPFGKFMPIDD